jgi:hypothetical protein
MAPVRTDLSEEYIAFIIRVEGVSEVGTALTVMVEAILSSETSDVTRSTRRYIPEDDILQSYRSGNLKSFIALTGWAL